MEKIFVLFCALALVGAKPNFGFGYRYANPELFKYSSGSFLSSTPSPYTLTRVIGNSFGRNPVSSFFGAPIVPRPSIYNIGPGSFFMPTRPPYQPPRISDTIFGNIDPTFASTTVAPPLFGTGSPVIRPTQLPTGDLFGVDTIAGSPIPVEITNSGVGGIDQVGASLFQPQNLEPIVTKHFYLHSAPEEPEDIVHKHVTIGKPERAYRVVFIKAPASNSQAHITASYAPKDEKTVIYVLSKKPQDVEIEDIVTPPPTEPSKPEVVFVKYKTPEEAAHAQNTIQAQYDQLGGISQVSDEGIAPITSVIGSLGPTGREQINNEILSDHVVSIVPTHSSVTGIHPLNQQNAYLTLKQ